MAQISAVIIGAGNRGSVYARYALEYPQKLKISAIVEKNIKKLEFASQKYSIDKNHCFSEYTKVLELGKIADTAIITTLDNTHKEIAIEFIKRGYDILLEKPLAVSLEDSLEIIKNVKKYNVRLMTCYVLRYSSFFGKLKELIQDDIIGPVLAVDQRENIGYFHMAHSYVRGNWHSTKESSPIILAKSCHDLDILHWMLEKRCTRMFSMGELKYFKKENMPRGAALRCMDCSEEENCPYSAKKIYLQTDNTGWPVSTITNDFSYAARLEVLKNTDYGKCVYQCGNDVLDYQRADMEFEEGVSVSFTLTAFTNDKTRKIHIYGGLGEITGDFEKGEITVHRFGEQAQMIKVIPPYQTAHAGSDFQMMDRFVQVMTDKTGSYIELDLNSTMESHYMAFAAEKSRNEKLPIDMIKFKREHDF
ncbi:MAG: Gfo/Idh/MocA family oxidoreductase [Petrotogaceae bacterium]|nr:Gfo/Idh/MocA family oxidoreductase [Petrotogaceae bacterium]